VRVRVVQDFRDHDRNLHYATYAGRPTGPEDLAEADAREALAHGWAVPA
jgi:hypothetical protein